MAYNFFYLSVIVLILLFLVCGFFRKPKLPDVIIGLTTVGYSLVNDILFGDRLKLYYYIDPQVSVLYMALSAIFVYAVLNMAYTMFLPYGTKKVFVYTICWIAAMLLFEFSSLHTKTIVFTGWRPFPWSIVIYIVTYLWVYYFYRYLAGRIPEKSI